MAYEISSIEFSMLPPDTVKNLARVRVVTSELYDSDGYPVEGGVMDPRLGVIDPGLHCRTCGGSIGECPGHFGYLELAKPIIHVLYTKTIYHLLKLTCRKCSRIMKDEDLADEFLESAQLNAPATCPHCKAKQKKITFAKPYSYYEDKDELNPAAIRERFERIPQKDLKKISFNGGRPEWLMITLFPIPPVTMRPSITLESGERSEDDLTHKLVDIVRINQSLKENIDIGAPEFILNDLWELVQYHISTYFDNELTGAPLARHRSGRALKGIIQRLKAKEGRLRGNLLGKRVNFSARTVISPDPRVSINEVGVPAEVAGELTVPLFVTESNLKHAKALVKSGNANYVLRPDGRRIKVTGENNADIVENLGIDWIVERQLKEGDITLFNRQPSLHRISIMAHRAKIMPYRTFRLNPSVCPPYNADFDGDEMNLHVPQTEEARVEAALLMEVHRNIISPKFGGPIIGLDLDQLSGICLLTKKGVTLNREDAAQLFASAGIEMRLPNNDTFTGKELFSMLLPKGIEAEYESNFSKKLDLPAEEKRKLDGFVSIKNGALLSGVIDKLGVGAEKGRIINKLQHFCTKGELKDFIDKCGRLGIAYLMMRGFSIGISDLDLSPDAHKKIADNIAESEKDARALIEQYGNDQLRILPGMTKKESLEAQIMNTLSTCVSRISEVINESLQRSDLFSMIDSGSKGSLINTTQMAAVVGQETILGKRIKRGYIGRTLPHMKQGDLSPLAHGFVSHGFKQGLSPFELFWNIMNGREGLMDKSLRTRKSGYMQRRLMNALQDMKVERDMTVRNAAGEIIQFFAGEDGIDPTKSDWGKLEWKELTRV